MKIHIYQRLEEKEPIAVKFGYHDDNNDFIIEHCNHARAEDRDCYPVVSYYSPNGDINYDTVKEEYMFCPDCKSYYDEQIEQWIPEFK